MRTLNKISSAGLYTAGLVLPLVAAIFALGYVVGHPETGEPFSELYLLGSGRMAGDYPRMLEVGEEGSVLLGVVNRERKVMDYAVVARIGKASEREVASVRLGNQEQWEGNVSFSMEEPGAVTRLVRVVEDPVAPFAVLAQAIEVESTDNLQAGDYIRVGGELSQVYNMTDRVIILSQPLQESHEPGADVIEVEKVAFKLRKVRRLGLEDEWDTNLSLWLGKEGLQATVTNESAVKATYRMEIEVDRRMSNVDREEASVVVEGPVILAPGKEWLTQVEYGSSTAANQKAQLSLYREGQLLYYEECAGGYPAVHLWLEVR